MHDLTAFGLVVLVASAAFVVALLSSRLSTRIAVPGPALFLLVAAAAATASPTVRRAVSVEGVERIATVALALILFEGGMHVGWRRFRGALAPISVLGLAGTFATAAALAAVSHYLLGVSWRSGAVLGVALAPTDPAVMFSVLGRRQVRGRTATILEGESGANDPVGIALMVGLLEALQHGGWSPGRIAVTLVLQLVVGTAVGLAGGLALLRMMRSTTLPNPGLYPLRVLAVTGLLYGVAAVLHGSGFLAVFLAGILVGDQRAPYKPEIERFMGSLASLGEMVVFAALGITISLTALGADWLWLKGIALALVMVLVVRPLTVGPMLLPVRLRRGERLFVLLGGLKGAVPILLAAFVVQSGIPGALANYHLVFVVVAFSIVVQGASMPALAARLGVPMRIVEPEPWHVAVGLRREPEGVQRFVVAPGAHAAGRRVRDLPLGEDAWISLVVHDGVPVAPRGDYGLAPGDELLVLAASDRAAALRRLFEGEGPVIGSRSVKQPRS